MNIHQIVDLFHRTDDDPINKALVIALEDGQVDGDHHKAWVIDQIVRALAQDDYEMIIKAYEENGMYTWDEGIAP